MTEVIRLDTGRTGGEAGGNAGSFDTGLEGIRALGFDHGTYYYLSPITQQVVQLNAADHGEANLCQLRELDWWAGMFPPTRAQPRFDVSRARDALMNACHRVGPFEPELVRGRGVWWDDAQGAIVHVGQWVHAGAKAWRPSEAPLRHIYEAAGSWPLLASDPLEDDEAVRLLEVCERFHWMHPCHARLLAGWLVTAMVCGAMRWRPHIALTGPRESGKTFVVEQVIMPVLGPIALHALGETTAAGIRQTLGRDARPIVWDEAEPQGAKGSQRVQEAIALARHLSPSGGGAVLKGGANHAATAFSGAASLCLVSIFAQMMRDADASRFTVLELASRAGRVVPEEDAATKRAVERLDAAFAQGLIGRAIGLLPQLRASHERFARAVGERWASMRLGDQLGALLAGAHLLGSSAGVTDEERCLQRLATWWARVDTAGGKRQVTRTLGELVDLVLRNGGDPDEIEPAQARRVLLRHGLRVAKDGSNVAVAAHHDRLRDIYRDTDFDGGWARVLERLPAAEKSSAAVRFGPGAQCRATVLPAELFKAQE